DPQLVTAVPTAVLPDDDARIKLVVQPGACPHASGRRLHRHPLPGADAARRRRVRMQFDLRIERALAQARPGPMLAPAEVPILDRRNGAESGDAEAGIFSYLMSSRDIKFAHLCFLLEMHHRCGTPRLCGVPAHIDRLHVWRTAVIKNQCRAIVNSLVSILSACYDRPMPRDARQTRRRILDAAYREFRRKGFVRVNVDEIAAASRVTKRTLYSHFRSKDELLAAALEAQIELAAAAKQALTSQTSGSTPEQIVESLFAALHRWSGKTRWSGSGFARVPRGRGRLPRPPP